MGGGGSKAVWNFSENSSVLERGSFPYGRKLYSTLLIQVYVDIWSDFCTNQLFVLFAEIKFVVCWNLCFCSHLGELSSSLLVQVEVDILSDFCTNQQLFFAEISFLFLKFVFLFSLAGTFLISVLVQVEVEICGESESVLLCRPHSPPVIVLTKTWCELLEKITGETPEVRSDKRRREERKEEEKRKESEESKKREERKEKRKRKKRKKRRKRRKGRKWRSWKIMEHHGISWIIRIENWMQIDNDWP